MFSKSLKSFWLRYQSQAFSKNVPWNGYSSFFLMPEMKTIYPAEYATFHYLYYHSTPETWMMARMWSNAGYWAKALYFFGISITLYTIKSTVRIMDSLDGWDAGSVLEEQEFRINARNPNTRQRFICWDFAFLCLSKRPLQQSLGEGDILDGKAEGL